MLIGDCAKGTGESGLRRRRRERRRSWRRGSSILYAYFGGFQDAKSGGDRGNGWKTGLSPVFFTPSDTQRLLGKLL